MSSTLSVFVQPAASAVDPDDVPSLSRSIRGVDASSSSTAAPQPTTLANKAAVELTKAVYRVQGMTCASCVNVIETYVGGLDGVDSCVVALLQECATVKFDAARISVRTITFFFLCLTLSLRLSRCASPLKTSALSPKSSSTARRIRVASTSRA